MKDPTEQGKIGYQNLEEGHNLTLSPSSHRYYTTMNNKYSSNLMNQHIGNHFINNFIQEQFIKI